MPTFKVRTVAGRIAREFPRGPMIPHDEFVNVEITDYTQRLLDVHGDIELEPETKPKPEEPVAEKAPANSTMDHKAPKSAKSPTGEKPTTPKGK